MISSIVFLVILIAIALFVIKVYNKLVAMKNHFKNAFAQIDVQMKRRHDLIPNLVETAKGFMTHERETLEAVIAARDAAGNALAAVAKDPGNAQLMSQLGNAEGLLGSALGKLNVAFEAYPELQANQNMMALSEEMTSTENKIAFSRQHFNDSVMHYNVYKQSFPNNIIAGIFGHAEDASLLEFDDKEQIKVAPKVQF